VLPKADGTCPSCAARITVGNVGFFVLYIGSGVFASLVSVAVNPIVVSAGASGAARTSLGTSRREL
jgi:membrane associated rhomboid family serine protease